MVPRVFEQLGGLPHLAVFYNAVVDDVPDQSHSGTILRNRPARRCMLARSSPHRVHTVREQEQVRPTFGWVECGRFWTAPEGPLFPLLVWDTIAVEDLRPHMTSRIDQQSARIHVVQLDLAYFLWVC